LRERTEQKYAGRASFFNIISYTAPIITSVLQPTPDYLFLCYPISRAITLLCQLEAFGVVYRQQTKMLVNDFS